MKISDEIILMYNILRILGWSQTMALIIYQTKHDIDDISNILNLVKAMTIGKCFEIVFIKQSQALSQRNILKYYIFLMRLIFQWYFMRPQLCFCSFRQTISGWAFMEITESIYYVSKSKFMKKLLSLLIFIYVPFTLIGMIRVINKIIERQNQEDYFKRLFQLILVIFVAVQLYINFHRIEFLKQEERISKLKA
ncbi:unnamed protein product [Paramecium pentaurelia]|uniref:Uncharacterized protein n=1 Tax=Paramecium pentaurelia TaxID=43138 RepID=A0A8S1VHE5_9CILI|nr:unnamed protein product [Paramecium pentaurelia]